MVTLGNTASLSPRLPARVNWSSGAPASGARTSTTVPGSDEVTISVGAAVAVRLGRAADPAGASIPGAAARPVAAPAAAPAPALPLLAAGAGISPGRRLT